MANHYGVIGQMIYEKLVADAKLPLIAETVLLDSGVGTIERGDVLAFNTATGKYVKMAASLSGCIPAAIASDPAEAGAKFVPAYLTGHFNYDGLKCEGEYELTAGDLMELRKVGILVTNENK